MPNKSSIRYKKQISLGIASSCLTREKTQHTPFIIYTKYSTDSRRQCFSRLVTFSSYVSNCMTILLGYRPRILSACSISRHACFDKSDDGELIEAMPSGHFLYCIIKNTSKVLLRAKERTHFCKFIDFFCIYYYSMSENLRILHVPTFTVNYREY